MFFTSNPLFPLNFRNISFIDSGIAFSPTLLTNMDGFSSNFGGHVIHEINALLIDTGGSSQSVPPWTQLRNTFTHALILNIFPKFGISNKFNIPTFSNLVAHSFVSSRISLVPIMLLTHKYFFLDRSGNLCASVISWSMNFSMTIFPSIYPSLLTLGITDVVSNEYFPLDGMLIDGSLSILSGR
jgi:hypothetical protein